MKGRIIKAGFTLSLLAGMIFMLTACQPGGQAAGGNGKAADNASADGTSDGNAPDKTEDSDYTFRYIVNNVGDITTFDIALAKGFFEENGVHVEETGVAGGGAAVIQTLAAGDADIGNAALPAYINAVSAGTKIRVIYGGPAVGHAQDPGYQILVAADSRIQSADDLVGKTVAVAARGAMFEYLVRLYMENAGHTGDDIDFLIVPSAQHEQVLKSGQVDACVDGSPIADQLIENGTAKNLTDLYHVLGEDLAGDGWGSIIRSELLESRPEAVERLVGAYIRSDEWVEANPEEAREVAKEILEKREQNAELAKYWHPFHLVDKGLWKDEHVQFWIDYLVKDGKVEEGKLVPSDIYTNEYNPNR